MQDQIGFGAYTAALVGAAAIAFASGVSFTTIGWVQRRDTLYISYGLLCLCVAMLAAFNAALGLAQQLTTAVFDLRMMSLAVALSFPPFVRFVAQFTGTQLVRPLWLALLAVALLFAVLDLVAPFGMLFSSLQAQAPLLLPWGERLSRVTGSVSVSGWVFHGLSYLVFAWAFAVTARGWRRGRRTAAVLLAACLLLQFAALLWGDLAVDLMQRPLPYLDVFAFLPFVLLMGVLLASRMRQRALQLERLAGQLKNEAKVRRDAEDRLRHLAYYDTLTGLPNRQYLLAEMAGIAEHAGRSGRRAALLQIDLDNFKTINDSLGHYAGDQLLEAVAERLRQSVDDDALVARLGGDEFAVLLPAMVAQAEEPVEATAQRLADHLCSRLMLPFNVENRVLSVGASMGVALLPEGRIDVDDIMRRADIALYQAKGSGRNAVRLFLPHMQHEADVRLEFERGLRTAVIRDELSLRFQPQVDAGGGLIGAEVLLRWRHPVLGEVPPSVFIPVAEETGLIHSIGAWVIGETCARIRAWRELGVPFSGRLAVNVSAWQLAHPNFVDNLDAQVRASGVDPSQLTLELTESALLNRFDNALVTLHRLARLGFRLALDDFGTGYSSLSYLQQLPLHDLKIDQSFVRALQSDHRSPLAGFIIDLGRHLSLRTIAEGVETTEQQQRSHQLGCDALQGYLISHPLDERGFVDWLRARYGDTSVLTGS